MVDLCGMNARDSGGGQLKCLMEVQDEKKTEINVDAAALAIPHIRWLLHKSLYLDVVLDISGIDALMFIGITMKLF